MNTTLVIPSIVYGDFENVRQRLSGAIRQFKEGRSWYDALNTQSMVSPETVPGLVVLNGPAPLLATEPHFHIFLPLSIILEEVRKGKLSELQKQQAFSDSLFTPWGLLGVIAPVNQMLVYPPELHKPILQAAIQWWHCLDALGPRYTVGLREGARLWNVTTNLHYVLGQIGLSNEQLRMPLPVGGLKAVIPAGVLDELAG